MTCRAASVKKAIVLWSSPNLDGLTAVAAKQLTAGISAGGAVPSLVHLNSLKIDHCRACGNGWGSCRTHGTCIIPDDFAPLYDRLADSDGIVFVSAVYFHDQTETMKAFLDRLRRCDAFTAQRMKDKRCLLVACAGGTGLGTSECLRRLEDTLKHMNMRAYDRLPVNRFNREYMLPALEKAGRVYARCLETGFDMGY